MITEQRPRGGRPFPWATAIAYLLALAMLVGPSVSVWFSLRFDLWTTNYDWLCGLLTGGQRASGDLLFAGQTAQLLLFLAAGFLFIRLWMHLGRVAREGGTLVPRWFYCAAFGISLAGLPWMNPDMFYMLGHGWHEVDREVNIFKTPLAAHPDAPDGPMFRNIDPTFLKQTGNYGPFNQLLSAQVAALSGGNVRIATILLKILFLAALVGSGWVVAAIARRLGVGSPAKLFFLYTANPLSLVAMLAWGHNDVFQNFFVLLSLLALVTDRPGAAGAALGAAIALKFIAVLMVPFIGLYALLPKRRPDWSAAGRFSLGLGVTTVVFFAIYPGSLDTFFTSLGTEWSTYRSSLAIIFSAMKPIFHIAREAHLFWGRILYGAILLALGFFLLRRLMRDENNQKRRMESLCSAAFWTYSAHLLILAPAVLEWYFTWTLGFALLAGSSIDRRAVLTLYAFFSVLSPFTLYRTFDSIYLACILQYLFTAACLVWAAAPLWRGNAGGGNDQ